MSKTKENRLAKAVFQEIEGMIEVKLKPSVKPTTLQEVIDLYRENFYLSKTMEQCFVVALAAHLGKLRKGTPLWVYIVGASSSGKSWMLELLTDPTKEKTCSMDQVSTLVSGKFDEENPEVDFSIINEINNKSWIISDFTTMLTGDYETYKKLCGQLRAMFDGRFQTAYGNGVANEYEELNFAMIVGVTEVINDPRYSTSELGERFLKCQIFNEDRDSAFSPISHSAAEQALNKMSPDGDQPTKTKKTELKNAVQSYIESNWDRFEKRTKQKSKLTLESAKRLVSLADLCAAARTRFDRDKNREITYEKEAERGARLSGQLIYLATHLIDLYDLDKENEFIMQTVAKVAFDTCQCRGRDVLFYICSQGEVGATVDQICESTGCSKNTAIRCLEDLMRLRLLQRKPRPNNSGNRGRDQHYFVMAEETQKRFEHVEEFIGDFLEGINASAKAQKSENTVSEERAKNRQKDTTTKTKRTVKRKTSRRKKATNT